VYIIEAAHNPEVAGSNPAPATHKGPGNGAFCLLSQLCDHHFCKRLSVCETSNGELGTRTDYHPPDYAWVDPRVACGCDIQPEVSGWRR
jgi:hypothetical protein